MTHATVLVRFEGNLDEVEAKVAEMMDMYDENKRVPKYKVFLENTDVESMAKHYKVDLTKPDALQKLVPHLKKWEGQEGGLDNGKLFYWSTYNPDSKWDWYQVGGRWQGLLALKPDAVGRYFRQPNINADIGSGLSIKEILKVEKGNDNAKVDIAFLKDVDFDKMAQIAKEAAEKDWAEISKLEPDDAERWFVYGQEKDETKETYIARHSVAIHTHAVLDSKGWHEASEMGWWGTDHARKEPREVWAQKFRERYLSNFTDQTVIAIVDYHI